MDRQQRPVQKPRWNCGRTDQHARVSRKQSSEDRRTKNEEARNDAQKLIECVSENLSGVLFERDQALNGGVVECVEIPGSQRHGRSMFKNLLHLEQEVLATKMSDEKNW